MLTMLVVNMYIDNYRVKYNMYTLIPAPWDNIVYQINN